MTVVVASLMALSERVATVVCVIVWVMNDIVRSQPAIQWKISLGQGEVVGLNEKLGEEEERRVRL